MGLVALMFAFGLVMMIVQGQPSIHELFQAIWISVVCWIAVLIHLLATVTAAEYSTWKQARDRHTS
ncbi:hypothetical protein AS96_11735 [Microbacterium sp. MRS-1]|nr:hypothetical protein AS96_11735 [Microbacterium sp. MRS-1]